jgi:hypothetical protein
MRDFIVGTIALVALGAWAGCVFLMACGKRRTDDAHDTDDMAAMRRRVETRRAALADIRRKA